MFTYYNTQAKGDHITIRKFILPLSHSRFLALSNLSIVTILQRKEPFSSLTENEMCF